MHSRWPSDKMQLSGVGIVANRQVNGDKMHASHRMLDEWHLQTGRGQFSSQHLITQVDSEIALTRRRWWITW